MVKRYLVAGPLDARLEEHDFGNYVSYNDYLVETKKLQMEIDELKNNRDNVAEMLNDIVRII